MPCATGQRDLAFISYSHQDVEWFKRLEILIKPYASKGHLLLWADPYIQVGARWEREIEKAIGRARIGVLLASQNFAASDFIANVELPALKAAADQGQLTLFCIPVSAVDPTILGLDAFQWARPPSEPLDLLRVPKRNQALKDLALKLVDLFHPTQETEESIGAGTSTRFVPHRPADQLARNREKPGALHGVPPIPPHFVARGAALKDLKASLFDRAEARFGISAAAGAGLHGQGGIGKTVLATALAHDRDVQQAFADGVYWVTLGQEPNLMALQVCSLGATST
jgi:hypothetical protein